jgi:hypothetical protein
MQLGLLNSRMKDFYGLALLARLYSFGGTLLARAVSATFWTAKYTYRGRPGRLIRELQPRSCEDLQWRAFLRRSRFKESLDLVAVVLQVRRFAHPLLAAISGGRPFDRTWSPDGPWTD